ncbi:capsular polysaccharide biosynthesis protein [Oceanobacillus picturae]|uniref:Capsular polysaccharide biosynthesis protein n=1 Tax=Oceanobacillus picturae TaxID=171693 RepID=A0A0U9HGK6_9BACI|nr:capsular polysaccharide biosynthesis protein [Oceanobacillus picturae]
MPFGYLSSIYGNALVWDVYHSAPDFDHSYDQQKIDLPINLKSDGWGRPIN